MQLSWSWCSGCTTAKSGGIYCRHSIHLYLGQGLDSDFNTTVYFHFVYYSSITQGARCVKVIMKSANCTDYIGTDMTPKQFINGCQIIGYQHYETTKCLIKTTRDNLYFVRCIYTVGFRVFTVEICIIILSLLVRMGSMYKVQCLLNTLIVQHSQESNESRYCVHVDITIMTFD